MVAVAAGSLKKPWSVPFLSYPVQTGVEMLLSLCRGSISGTIGSAFSPEEHSVVREL